MLAVMNFQNHRAIDTQLPELATPCTALGSGSPTSWTPARGIDARSFLDPRKRKEDGLLLGHDMIPPWIITLA